MKLGEITGIAFEEGCARKWKMLELGAVQLVLILGISSLLHVP